MKRRIFWLFICSVCGIFVVETPKLDAAEIRFSLQSAYAPWREALTPAPSAPSAGQPLAKSTQATSAPRVSNRAWTTHGHALLAARGDSVEKFVSYTEDQIRDRLKRYLASHPALNPKTDDLIILDIERPVHPKRIGEYSGKEQAQIIEAFKKRIKIARQEFPNAKLSLFGVAHPVATGDSSSREFKDMMQGFNRASQLGMFDDLDYLSPVLYFRFGPKDKKFNTIEAYTRQGIEASHTLKTRKGTPLPLAPFLSFKVLNSGSQESDQCISHELIQKQMKIVQEYPYVQIVVLWASGNGMPECETQKFMKTLASGTGN